MKKILSLFLCTLMLITSCQKADNDADLELDSQVELEQDLDLNLEDYQDEEDQNLAETQHVNFFVIDRQVVCYNPSSGKIYTAKNPSDILILSSIEQGILYGTEAFIESNSSAEFIVGTEFINLGSHVYDTLDEAESYSVSCLDRALYTANSLSLTDYDLTKTTENNGDYTYQAVGTHTNHSLLANNNSRYNNAKDEIDLVAYSNITEIGGYYVVQQEPNFMPLIDTAYHDDKILLFADEMIEFYTEHKMENGTITGEKIYSAFLSSEQPISTSKTASLFLDYHNEKIFLQSLNLEENSYTGHNMLQYIDVNSKQLVDLDILATPIAIKNNILYYVSDKKELCALNLGNMEQIKLSEVLSEHEHNWSGYIIDDEIHVIARELSLNTIDLHEIFSIK